MGARVVPVCAACVTRPIHQAPAPVVAARAATPVGSPPDLEPVDEPPTELTIRRVRPSRLHLVPIVGLAAGVLVFVAHNGGTTRRPTLNLGLSTLLAAPPPPPPPAPPPLAPPPPPSLVHPLPGPERYLPINGSCAFGALRESVPIERRRCGGGHCGVDIGNKIGTPILAIEDGTVSTVVRYDNDRGGLYVRVDHDDGTSSHYFHLLKIRDDLRRGMRVKAGEEIAWLGVSGNRDTPAHLHFGLSKKVHDEDKFFDPLPTLKKAAVIDAPLVRAPASEEPSKRATRDPRGI